MHASLVDGVQLQPGCLGSIRLVPDHFFQLEVYVADLVVKLINDSINALQGLHRAEVRVQVVDDVQVRCCPRRVGGIEEEADLGFRVA